MGLTKSKFIEWQISEDEKAMKTEQQRVDKVLSDAQHAHKSIGRFVKVTEKCMGALSMIKLSCDLDEQEKQDIQELVEECYDALYAYRTK